MTSYDYSSSDQPVPDFPGLPSVGAAGSPSLDSEETSEQIEDDSSYRHFITSGCRGQMLRAKQVLERLTDDKSGNRLTAFAACRSSAWFVRHAISGKIRVASSRCGIRWCPLCIRTKRFIIQQTVGAWVKSIKQPKFLTLTLKHTPSPLPGQIDSLYSAWKELRRRPWFKSRVKGGIWFFQVKKSASDGLWHPHIHILFEGRFIEHEQLKQIWSNITHGSTVVDIRAVKNAQKAADYVARYAACPCNLCDLELDRAVEVVESLHSRRICGTFGSGRAIKLTPKAPDDAKDWKFIGSFKSVINMAYSKPEMREVLKCWKSGDACNWIPPEPKAPPNALDLTLKAEPETFRQLEFIFCK
jgi:hypothetical protein